MSVPSCTDISVQRGSLRGLVSSHVISNSEKTVESLTKVIFCDKGDFEKRYKERRSISVPDRDTTSVDIG